MRVLQGIAVQQTLARGLFTTENNMQEPENTTLVIDDAALATRALTRQEALSLWPEPPHLTPDKARTLMEFFARQIRSLNPIRAVARRLVTAQRPFYERYRFKPHQGAQEMARRVRQMKRGHCPSLVVVQDGRRFTVDSHGVMCRFYS